MGNRNFLLGPLKFTPTLLLSGAAIFALSSNSYAQENSEDAIADEIVVTGSRLPANISSVPGSVTLLKSKEILEQSVISTDLGATLAFSVPGFAPSAKDGNNFSQTLRGRKPAFFIDGLPQSTALRNGGRDLRIIHPFALEQIEVIRGSTSIYGLGGSGGVINYITKRPAEGELKFFTEVGVSSSLTNVGGDSMEYLIAQGISVKSGPADFIGNVSYVNRGLFYDANGDPLPPDPYGQTGLADMQELSVFGKGGYDVSSNARLEFMGTYYSGEVDTDYTVGQGSFAAGIPSIAVPAVQNNINLGFFPAFDFIGDKDPENHNLLLAGSLILNDVLGSSVKTQVFYQDSDLIWRHLDFLPFGLGGFGPDGSQLTTDASKIGARIDIKTPIKNDIFDGHVLWGVDLLKDKVQEGNVDGRKRTSELEQDSLSFFAQFQGDLNDWLTLRGGVRYDDFSLDVPDYSSLDIFDPTGTLAHPVIGAELDYTNFAGNFGATAKLSENINLFASWSEGFSIGDVMRTLRNLRPPVPVATPVTFNIATLGLAIEPTSVTSYEAGVRYNSDRLTGSITGFISKSDLGATFDSVTFQTVRAPENIHGIEFATDINITDSWRLGGSYVWQDSEVDTNADGKLDSPLDYSRVPPNTIKFYTEYDVYKSWTVRLQGVSLMDASRFDAPFGNFERDVEGYTLIDLLVSGDLANGKLSVGVENLFNNDSTPFATFMACPDSAGAGAIIDSFCNIQQPGARGSIRYTIEY